MTSDIVDVMVVMSVLWLQLAGRARRDRVVGQDRDGPVPAGSYKVTPTTGRAKRSPARSTDRRRTTVEVSALALNCGTKTIKRADADGVTVSEVVRRALAEYLRSA